MIIDTHTHLLDKSFDTDREIIIETLLKKDIFVIENANTVSEWSVALTLAHRFPNFFVSLGLHPHYADSTNTSDLDALNQLLKEKKVVGVGETGLDYHYKNSNSDLQRQIFIKHIELSFHHNKPLVVHCRDAYEDCLSVLKERSQRYRGVVHCFSGSLEYAERFIKLGFFLGVDAPLTYSNAKVLREVVEKIPLENILVETDCPYLPPQDFRGKRNEPSYIKYVIEKIAELKNLSPETVAEITTQNARGLFAIS